MIGEATHRWEPDLRYPARSRTQAFVARDAGVTLRIQVAAEGRSELEVNERRVAEAPGFAPAKALAELYTRGHELLLRCPRRPHGPSVYLRCAALRGRYQVRASDDPVALVTRPSGCRRVAEAADVVGAARAAADHLGCTPVPAFDDQREIYHGLGQEGPDALLVAAWVARSALPFVRLIDEPEHAPLFLAYARSRRGACLAIYRLVSREFLAEYRSEHRAEEIGRFLTLEQAHAHCQLYNAAHHSAAMVELKPCAAAHADGGYSVRPDNAGRFQLTGGRYASLLGSFPTARLAEVWAIVHGAALDHFAA